MANGNTPPNKWSEAFSTQGMTKPSDFSDAINALAAKGFTGPVAISPAPRSAPDYGLGNWVSVGGYDDDPHES
jgi:hypothetical protein